MALKEVVAFKITSSIDAPSDGFDARLASSKTFVEAVPNDAVELKAGLVDPDTGTPVMYSQLQGWVDRYRLQIRGDSTTGNAVGRDTVAALLDRRTRWLFSRSPINSPGPTLDRVFVGTWQASQIAQILVEHVGLELLWECRDYIVAADFSAVGRIIDSLSQLVAPWNKIEMFKVDIFANGQTIIVKARPGTVAVPDLTIDAQSEPRKLRASEISVEKRRLPLIGKVFLSGGSGGGGGVVILQSYIREDEQVSEAYNGNGSVKSRTVTVTRTQMPDSIMLDRHSTTWVSSDSGLVKEKEEFTEMTWSPSAYDNLGRRVSKPRMLQQTTRVWGKTGTGAWDQLSEHLRGIGYDANHRVTQDDVTKYERDGATGTLTPDTREVKEYTLIANGMTEEVTSRYSWDSGKKAFALSELNIQRNHGGLQEFGLTGGDGPGTTGSGGGTELLAIISDNPLAEDVTLSDANLTRADFLHLVEEYRQVSGKWRYEIRIPQVAMPWVTKGMTLQVTNVPVGTTLRNGAFEVDAAISLPAGVIASREFSYDESGNEPSMTATLTVLAWSDT